MNGTQANDRRSSPRSVALVLAGHGSHRNPDSARPVFDHADRIRKREVRGISETKAGSTATPESGGFAEVREAFWKEEPSLREALRTVESGEVVVVPLFMAEGYFTEQVLPRELRVADGWDLDVDKTVHYTRPVGTHDAMTDVVLERATGVLDADPGDAGLAVVGHGTERNENSAATTQYHARRARERGEFDEVRALFMDEDPVIDDVTDHFDCRDVAVVPLFLADGYHTREDIPEDMGLTDDYRTGWEVPAEVGDHRVWYAGAVGTEPLLADVALERAEAALAGDDDSVTRRTASTADRTASTADRMPSTASRTPSTAVPERSGSDEDRSSPPTQSTTDGTSPTDALVAAVESDETVDFDGLRAERGPVGFTFETTAAVRQALSESEFRNLARDSFYVANWHYWERTVADHGTFRRKFLRWLEGDAPIPDRYDALRAGVTREWSQLALTVRLDEAGDRCYEVRHVADRGTDPADLDRYDDPLDARELARRDPDGEYRPLKGAPTLRDGWVLPDLDGDELVAAVECFYPASVPNWARERDGDLDVTHFRETAERQTGIYEMVAELGPEAVERAATACCADSECLKRREWEYDEGEQLDAPAGEGEIPCREPCSLFVAAAREFTKIERDGDDADHSESAVETVAEDGRARLGNVSDDGNRLRARYLREKYFSGDD